MNYIFARQGPFRVLILLLLLSGSLLVLGGVGWFFVRQSNKMYSDLIRREFVMLNLVRDIVQNSNSTRRLLDTAFDSNSPDTLAEFRRRFDEATSLNNTNFATFALIMGDARFAEFDALTAARARYINLVRSYLRQPASSVEEAKARRDRVEAMFTDYLACQDALALRVQDNVKGKQQQFTHRGSLLSVFFLIMAMWPLIMAGLVFTYALGSIFLVFLRAPRHPEVRSIKP